MKVIKMTGTHCTTTLTNRKIEYLAIHYSAGTSCAPGKGADLIAWFRNQAADGSADYVVDERDFYQYNPDPYNRYCHAVGGGRYNTKGGRLYGTAKNSNCISLEIVSGNRTGKITYPNDPNYYFTTTVIAKAIEATKYLMDLYNIPPERVIRHYDVNGKPCPGIIGWNADSGSEAQWEAFHEAIGGAPIEWFRVRMSWDKPETQLGAFTDKNNAIACADAHPGFSVYDGSGKCIYTSKADERPPEGETEAERWINRIAPDAVEVGQKNGILPSVIIAQGSLETGWGKTDLAQRNNIFGMKCDLINGTWDEWSTWDHVHYYEKYSPEEEGGKVVQRKSKFRVYDSIRQCIEDYCGFLLHVRNNKGLKYACIHGERDPEKVIHRIYVGTGTDAHPEGYATDSGYPTKIMNLIRKYDLTKYDSGAPTHAPTPEPTPTPAKKKMYRVQVEADRKKENAESTVVLIRNRTGFDSFIEKEGGWWKVFCGSFEKRKNAEERAKKISDEFKNEKRFQNPIIKEIEV